jgi:hypothetical protein
MLVTLKLRLPIVCARFRDVRVDTSWVAVPKTAPHINYLSPESKDEIGLAGQLRYMQPVPKPHRVNEPPYNDLGLRVLCPNTTHIFRTVFGRERVSQTSISSRRPEISLKRFPFTMIFRASSASDSFKFFHRSQQFRMSEMINAVDICPPRAINDRRLGPYSVKPVPSDPEEGPGRNGFTRQSSPKSRKTGRL